MTFARRAPSFLLGALPLLVYWTGTVDGMIWPKWVALALLATACLAVQRDDVLPPAALAWVLAAGAITALWTLDRYSAADEMVHAFILAAVFCLGYQSLELDDVWVGVAVAVTLNVWLLAAQSQGYTGVPQSANSGPAGFLANRNFAGELCAMTAAYAIARRGRWLLWSIVPIAGLLIAGSKAGAVGLCCAVATSLYVARRRAAMALLAALAVVAGYMLLTWNPSVAVRVDIWVPLLRDLSWSGHGLSSFAVDWPYEEWAHNEPLQIVYEQGVFAIPALAIALTAIWKALDEKTPEGCVVVALAVISLLGFPLRIPATALVGVLAAGCVLGREPGLRRAPHHRAAAPGSSEPGGARRRAARADVEGGRALPVRPA